MDGRGNALPHVTVHDASPAQITRLNQRYEPLLNLAGLFLDGGALQMQAGDVTTFAFVFDMNQLFEMFLAKFIQRHREEILPDNLKGCALLLQSRGISLYLAERACHGEVFRLKPDLVFLMPTENSDKPFPLLLDMKYKILDRDNRRQGVAPDDFYQMHAYAHRYKCPRVVLVYPQIAEMLEPLREAFELQESDKIVTAATVDLRIRLETNEGRRHLKEELTEILKKAFEREEQHAESKN